MTALQTVLGLFLQYGIVFGLLGFILFHSNMVPAKERLETLLLIGFTLLLLGGKLVLISFSLSIDWILIVVLIIKNRSKLYTYFISTQNLLKSIAVGSVQGLIFTGIVIILVSVFKLKLSFGNPSGLSIANIGISVLNLALIEELVTRGFLFGFLKRSFSLQTANILQSIISSALHIMRYLFSDNWPLLIALVFFSFCWGFITNKYKSIIGSWISHSIMNFSTILLYSI